MYSTDRGSKFHQQMCQNSLKTSEVVPNARSAPFLWLSGEDRSSCRRFHPRRSHIQAGDTEITGDGSRGCRAAWRRTTPQSCSKSTSQIAWSFRQSLVRDGFAGQSAIQPTLLLTNSYQPGKPVNNNAHLGQPETHLTSNQFALTDTAVGPVMTSTHLRIHAVNMSSHWSHGSDVRGQCRVSVAGLECDFVHL